MRRFALLLVVASLLAGFPAAAMAGGSGPESCPSGLARQELVPEKESELTQSKHPWTVEGVILIPSQIERSEAGPTYDFTWGTHEASGVKTYMLCGVKPDTGPSESLWIFIAVLAGFLGIVVGLLLVRPPRQQAY